MDHSYSGSERRGGDDRRSGDERRSVEKPLPTDSRSGHDRRSKERRTIDALREILSKPILTDAPIDTPVTYSRDEAAKVRAQVKEGSNPVICPRCGKPLEAGPLIPRKEESIQELVCVSCHRCLMVKTGSD